MRAICSNNPGGGAGTGKGVREEPLVSVRVGTGAGIPALGFNGDGGGGAAICPICFLCLEGQKLDPAVFRGGRHKRKGTSLT